MLQNFSLRSNLELANKPRQLSIFDKVKKPSLWLRGLITAGLLGTATTAYLAVKSVTPKASAINQMVVVQSKDLTVRLKANGLVQPRWKINLSPKHAGRIVKLYVDEGDRVEQGQLVARMDSEQFQAQVNQYNAALAKAQADLAQKQVGSRPEEIAEAKARVAASVANVTKAQAILNQTIDELKRNQQLAQQGAISQNSLNDFLSKELEAKADLEAEEAQMRERRKSLERLRNGTRPEEIAQAEADVAQARAQLKYYQIELENNLIRAPFVGTITRRFAQEGDFVTPTTSASSSDGATSTSITELSSGLEVEAKVPEASIARIKSGQQVEIRSDAYPDDSFKGHIRLVAPTAVEQDKVTSFRVKVLLETGQGKLKSGMKVKLSFIGDPIRNALIVPLEAIVTKKDGQTGVLVPDGKNQAQFRPVTIGLASGDQVQVLQGLSKGEQILLSPPEGQIIPGVDTMGP